MSNRRFGWTAGARSLERKTVHLQERQLVPVAALEGDPTVSNSEEPASAQTKRVTPFKSDNVTSLVNRFRNADHLCRCKFLLKHVSDRFAPLNWILCNLMIHRVVMVEFRNARCIPRIEAFNP